MSTGPKVVALGLGFILAGLAGWISVKQTIESNKTGNVLKLIAVANGIDPDQTIESLAAKTLEKQLGTEAVALSQEIFKFIDENNIFQTIILRPDSWNEDVKRMLDNNNKIMRLYDEKFSTKSLLLLDIIKKTGAVKVVDRIDEIYFEYPTNPNGIREIANALERIGNTMLYEATEKVKK
jgi:hypothetical protein